MILRELRYGTVKKLVAAQELLELQDVCLKNLGAFRPVIAQIAFCSYAAEESFCPVVPQSCVVPCEQFVSLRSTHVSEADTLATIGVDETCRAVAIYGDFSLVEYYRLCGYVLGEYLLVNGL